MSDSEKCIIENDVEDWEMFVNHSRDIIPDDSSIIIPIIICCKTGILWSQQSGHYGCDHPRSEGYVIPFIPVERIHNECDWIQDYDESEKKELMEKIDSSLSFSDWNGCNGYIVKIRCDYERINEIMEGWIPVNVWMSKTSEPKKGYMCLGNCD